MPPTTTRLWALGCCAALGGCCGAPSLRSNDNTDAHVDDTGPIVEPPDCPQGVKRPTLPDIGAADVFYRTPFAISFFYAEAGTASFTLVRDADGSTVGLTAPAWSESGKDATFEAVAPLEPATAYTLEVRHSCSQNDPSRIRFTTGSTGAAVDYEADVAGKAFALDLATATILQPAGVQSLAASLLGQLEDAIVLVPTGVDGDDLTLIGATARVSGDEASQDVCAPTFDLGVGDVSENPYMVFSLPTRATLSLFGAPIPFVALAASGAFAPGGARLDGVRLTATLDTRGLIDVLGEDLGDNPADDGVCTLFEQLTSGLVRCEDCPDDAGPYCLTIVAANITGQAVTGDFAPITPDDVAANEACAAP